MGKEGTAEQQVGPGGLSARVRILIPEWQQLTKDEIKVGYKLIKKVQSAYRNPAYQKVCRKIAQNTHNRKVFINYLEILEQMQNSDPLWDIIQIFNQFRGVAFQIIAKNVRRAIYTLVKREKEESNKGNITSTIGNQIDNTKKELMDAL